MAKLDPIQLGNEIIHPLQQRMATASLELLHENEKPTTRNKRSPIVILQPQGGKTGVIIQLISLFIADCMRRKRTFQVIVFCGLPHLDLTKQTTARLTASMGQDGLTPVGACLHAQASMTGLIRYPAKYQRDGIVILHNSQKLRREDFEAAVDVRLWIGDEIHLGNVRDGNIDIMLQNHGVRLCEQIHTWDKDKTVNHFVGVSATPPAHMLKSDNIGLEGEALFRWIYEAPPPNYNSLAVMRRKGRLHPTEPLFLAGGGPTEFLMKVCADFHKSCKALGPGYLVIRATGKKHERLLDYLNRKGRRIEVREFDSDNGNIDELNSHLSTKPTEPMFVIIRGSMRAGITLGHDHYIRGWVETESATSDSQAQSGVGRACGYDRTDETYPIYCDLDHVDSWIKAYDKLDKGEAPLIPSGIQNRGMKTRTRYGLKEILTWREAWDTYVKPHRDADKKEKRADEERSQRYRTQLSSTSGNVYNDVAGMFLLGRRDSGSTLGLHVDGPTSDEAVEEFIADHKEIAPEKVWGWARRNRDSYTQLLQMLAEKFPHENFTVAFDPKAKGNEPKMKGRVLVFNTQQIEVVDRDGKIRRRTTGHVEIDMGVSRDALQKVGSAVRSRSATQGVPNGARHV